MRENAAPQQCREGATPQCHGTLGSGRNPELWRGRAQGTSRLTPFRHYESSERVSIGWGTTLPRSGWSNDGLATVLGKPVRLRGHERGAVWPAGDAGTAQIYKSPARDSAAYRVLPRHERSPSFVTAERAWSNIADAIVWVEGMGGAKDVSMLLRAGAKYLPSSNDIGTR